MIQVVNRNNKEKYGAILHLDIIVQWLFKNLIIYNGNKQVAVNNLIYHQGGIAMLNNISIIYSNSSKVRLRKSKLNQIGVVLEMHNPQMLEVRIQLKE